LRKYLLQLFALILNSKNEDGDDHAVSPSISDAAEIPMLASIRPFSSSDKN
jgi:hypothetical protein